MEVLWFFLNENPIFFQNMEDYISLESIFKPILIGSQAQDWGAIRVLNSVWTLISNFSIYNFRYKLQGKILGPEFNWKILTIFLNKFSDDVHWNMQMNI